MSFEEIGAVLGVTPQCASQIYQSAMRKLQSRPHVIACLRSYQHDIDAARFGNANHSRRTPPKEVPA